jgi:predicted ester cyclase
MAVNETSLLERNKAIVRRCIDEVWTRGEMAAIAEIVDPSFRRHHERNQDQNAHGLEGFAAWVREVRGGMPDLKVNIVLMVAENDLVMVHLQCSATHQGELKGVAASDTPLAFTMTAIVRLAEEKICECWAIADTLGILQRVGAVASLG